MPAYIIVDVEVTDPDTYAEYRGPAAETVEELGGRYLVRGGRCETLQGDWAPSRIVVLEFPDMGAATRWWSSPEYEPVRALRHRAAQSRMIAVEGVS